MNASVRKLGALMGKDVTDMLKNPTMIVCIVMPVAFVLLYRYIMGNVGGSMGMMGGADMGADADMETVEGLITYVLLNTALCMTIGMTSSAMLVYGLAEEKEKHTLRTLMLANVSAGQVALAKGLVSLAAILVVAVACFALTGVSWQFFGGFIAFAAVGSVPIILLGLVLGLAARDQMTAGLYSMPILVISLVPLFTTFAPEAEFVAGLTPLGGVCDLLLLMIEGNLMSADALVPVAVTLAWTVAGALAFKLLYRKLAQDN